MRSLINVFSAIFLCCGVANVYAYDLSIASITTAKEYAIGYSYPCNITVKNLEYNLQYGAPIGLYLSTDSIITTSDPRIGYYNIPSLPNGTLTYTLQLNIDASYASGNYYLFAVIDPEGEISEINKENNKAFTRLHLSAGHVDLYATSKTNLGALYSGQLFEVQSEITNQGNIAIAGYKIGYYLSTDALLSANDQLLDSSHVGLTSASSTRTLTKTLILPQDVGGSYYILSVADFDKSIAESSETNNVAARPVNITLATTVILPTSGSSTVKSCTSIIYDNGGPTANYTQNSNGYVTLYPSGFSQYVSLRFSSIVLGNSNDYIAVYDGISPTHKLIKKFYKEDYGLINATNADGALTLQLVSSGGTTGSGFTAYTNCKSEIYKPDLTVRINPFSDNNVASAGSAYTATATVYNLSNGYCLSSYTSIYLSEDQTLDTTNDVFLGEVLIPELLGNTSFLFSKSVTIPNTTKAGTYYLIYEADSRKQHDEVYEMNTGFQELIIPEYQVVQDLKITNFSKLIPLVDRGEYIFTSITAQNAASSSNYMNVGYYFSKDSIWDSKDLVIGSKQILPSIIPTTWTESISIPQTAPYGPAYLIAVADHDRKIREIIESNNTRCLPIVVMPPTTDLKITELSTSNHNIVLGSTILSCKIKEENINFTNTRGHYIQYYISKDTILSSDDLTRNRMTVNEYRMGAYFESVASVSLPSNLALGTYYLIAVADMENLVAETNENNNSALLKFAVVTPSYDFNPYYLYLSSPSLLPGASFYASISQYNLGNTINVAANVGIYLSKDSLWDSSDLLQGSIALGFASPANGSFTITLPLKLEAQKMYTLAVSDYDHKFSELNEMNNVIAKSFNVLPTDVDLVIETAAFTSETSKDIPLNSIFSISYTERNMGSTIAYEHSYACFLSKDSIYSSEDSLLSSTTVASLDPYYTKTTALTLSSKNLKAGEYFLLLVTDPSNSYKEKNESNNTKALKCSFIKDYYDLKNISSNLTGKLVIGQKKMIGITNGEFGNNMAAGFAIGYYLSEDSVWSQEDVLLHKLNTLAGPIPGKTSLVQYEYTVPNTIVPKQYYVIVKLDVDGQITEVDENNNTKAYLVSVENPTVDLALSSQGLRSTIVGQKEYARWQLTETSVGNIMASTHKLEFYLSKDSLKSADDITLLSYSITVDLQSKFNVNLQIPSTTVMGNYYLLAMADAASTIVESQETNNTIFEKLTVVTAIPDLQIWGLQHASGTIVKGNNIVIKNTYANAGYGSSASFYVHYYISKDSIYDIQDIALKNSVLGGISYLTSTTYEETLTSSQDTGSYFIIAKLDNPNSISETNESNNTKAMPLRIIPVKIDFWASNLAILAPEIKAGTTFNATFTSGVKGNASNGTSSSVRFVLSKDTVLSTEDADLFSYTLPALGLDTTHRKDFSMSTPSNTVAGDYYIIGTVYDPKDSFLKNNYKYVKIKINAVTPDLRIDLLSSASSIIDQGEKLVLTINETNIGDIPAPAHDLGYYLSSDSIWDLTDSYLTAATVPQLAVGASATYTHTITIPLGTATKNYYLLSKTDYKETLFESIETNNLKSVAIKVEASEIDLTIRILKMPSWVQQSASVEFLMQIQNLGKSDVSQYYMGIYVSKDSILDTKDTLVRFYTIPSMEGYLKSMGYQSFKVPSLPSGSYYLIEKIDYRNHITETNESNNVSYTKINIAPLDVRLSISNVKIIDSISPTNDLGKVTFVSTNNSSLSVYAHDYYIYLSKDSILGAGDRVIGSRTVDSIGLGASKLLSLNLQTPFNHETGPFYLIVATSHDLNTTIGSSTYYVVGGKITVAAPEVDLRVKSFTLPRSQYESGNPISPSLEFHNIGSKISEYCSYTVYMSKDTLHDASDITIYTSNLPQIKGGETTFTYFQGSIPLNLETGEYYILIVVDSKEIVYEFNENNNKRIFPIFIGAVRSDPAITQFEIKEKKIAASNYIHIHTEEYNRGRKAAATRGLNYYLSSDSIKDSKDLVLKQISLPASPIKNVIYMNDSLYMPLGLANGKYYIIAIIDENGYELEERENNNIAIDSIYINTPLCDLFTKQIQFKNSSITSASSFIAYVTLANATMPKTLAHYNAYYLSKDSLRDESDSLLAYRYIAPLQGNETTTQELSLQVPSLPSGSYYLLAVNDAFGIVAETNEDNNLKSKLVSVLNVVTWEEEHTRSNSLFSLYPNPSSGIVHLNNNGLENVSLEISDLQNKIIHKEEAFSPIINLSHLENGIYILRFKQNNQFLGHLKLLINK